MAGRGKGRCQHVRLVLTNASRALASATHDGHKGYTISVFQRECRGDSLLNDIVHHDADRGFDFPSHRLQLLSRFREPRGDLERTLDIERGHTKAKDTLPRRLIEGEVDVNGKRVKLGEETWDRLRDEYYRYRGWSPEGGPT